MNQPLPRVFGLLLVVLSLQLVGCGGGNLAQVTGKVTANGQPVTEGTLLFSPIAGSTEGEGAIPATAEIQSDGTFTVSTEKPGDGAAVGKHRISYTPPIPEAPDWDGYGKKPEVPKSPFAGFTPTTAEVEIKSGANELTIELAPPRR